MFSDAPNSLPSAVQKRSAVLQWPSSGVSGQPKVTNSSNDLNQIAVPALIRPCDHINPNSLQVINASNEFEVHLRLALLTDLVSFSLFALNFSIVRKRECEQHTIHTQSAHTHNQAPLSTPATKAFGPNEWPFKGQVLVVAYGLLVNW